MKRIFAIVVSTICLCICSQNKTYAQENVYLVSNPQTEAGSFDCFILEETISTKTMMMKDVERTKSWYAYGIGLVKEITYDKNGKMTSSMILNKVNY